MKKRVCLSILLSVYMLVLLPGQMEKDSIPGIGLIELSQVNQDNSYVTFPTDIGNIEPLWFEANLIPNFYIRQSDNSRLLGVLTPQIILRMYQERSYPVRTPSYMPQITIYYMLKELDEARKLSLFGRWAHHSNGQDGAFYDETGQINLKSGDFSTNYLESGLIFTNINTRLHAYQFFKTSFEVHPEGWNGKDLEGIYGKYRWHQAVSIYRIPAKQFNSGKKKAGYSFRAETNWMFGDLNNWDSYSLKRLNFSLTLYYHPNFLEDIGFFARYNHGTDYYNIYFDHRLDVLRFGIMTEKLRF